VVLLLCKLVEPEELVFVIREELQEESFRRGEGVAPGGRGLLFDWGEVGGEVEFCPSSSSGSFFPDSF